MITYESRYSETDEPDKFGRWARVARVNWVKIAWVNRMDKNTFTIQFFFPVDETDFPTGGTHKAHTFNQCKTIINDRWNEFLKKIKQ